MDEVRSRRLRDLFLRARDLSLPERQAFLARECADDEELASWLSAMLAKDDRSADSPLEAPLHVAADEPGELQRGARVGPYRVDERIGAGGMGTVYRSRLVDPAAGTSTILPSNFALTDSGVPVEWANVEMRSADVGLIFADFNGDQRVDHFDQAHCVPHSYTAAGDTGYERMFDLDSISTIDQKDLDLLMSGMY